MKLLAVLLLLSGCASKMETAWQVAHAVDGLQTLSIAGDECYEERNPITRSLIGRDPSEGDVVAWYLGTAFAHAWMDRQLEPYPRWQKLWQSLSLVVVADAIVQNHEAGVRVTGKNVGC